MDKRRSFIKTSEMRIVPAVIPQLLVISIAVCGMRSEPAEMMDKFFVFTE